MKKRIRLTESDLVRLVKRVIKEQGDLNIKFDPTKKVPSEPENGQTINPNKEAFEKIKAAFLALDPANPEHKAILDLQRASRFVPTSPENYQGIEEAARAAGLLE